jgi:hypothetical protein
MNRLRTRTALAAVLALASSPTGFTVTELTTKARAMTGQAPLDYTVRQAAYDLKKLRGKGLITKLGRARRYHVGHAPCAPSPHCSSSASTSSVPSSPVFAHLASVANPPPGPPSTVTMNNFAFGCSLCLRAGYRGLDNSLSLRLWQAASVAAHLHMASDDCTETTLSRVAVTRGRC